MDAQISDVVITLDKRWEDNLPGALTLLKIAGLEVSDTDDDRSVVCGTIDANKLEGLEKLDCVEYVRTILTFCAEYPPGDPRDTNGI